MIATTHPVAPEELMAFLDGELSAAQTQSISAHLESCAACQEQVTSLRSTYQCLSNWIVGHSPSQIEDRVLAAPATKSSYVQTPDPRNLFDLPSQKRNRWVFGLAAVGFAFLVLVVILNSDFHRAAMSTYAPRPAGRPKSVSQESDGTLDSVRSTIREEQPMADSNGELRLRIREKGKNTIGVTQNKVAQSSAEQAYQSQIQNGPMIARTISLSIITKDFDASRNSLDAILARHNGYAAGLNVSTPQGAARALQASLRIPAPQLVAALLELKSLGRLETESQNGEEVTQQHADLVARLKNSRETEQRLQAILLQRTGKISDVLEVEQEIARVRGEIEQMEAEQKNIEHRVDFATIDLRLSEEYKATLDSPAPSVATQFHNALINGYSSATDSLLGLLLFFVQYVPILFLWIAILSSPAWLLWRRWKRASAMV
jgi:hypothetical protein